MKKHPISRKNNLVVQEIDNEVLIYDLDSNKAFCLNQTSALVWDLCDGDKSIEEISQDLSKKLNSPANEELVWLALDQLKKENLIINDEAITTTFEGLNRRQVIRKVGFTSMIALPIVSSIVAPLAVDAATGSCQGNACSLAPPVSACCAGNACRADGNGVRCCAGSPGSPTCFGTLTAGASAGTSGGSGPSCRAVISARCCSCMVTDASYFDGPNCSGTCA